jgi:aryl-alcohol dehydrogenase-like predicted oxidoreductase
MEYRSLGRTGVTVSAFCLGNLLFGARPEEQAEEERIIDRALDLGVNFLDTANSYERGACEERLGRVLRRDGKRQRVVLATKVHGRMDDHDPNAAGASRRHIIEQCEASLRRLQTDYIDLYQLHRPTPEVAIDETLRALDDLVRTGKVRYLGTSSFAAWQVVDALWAAKELRLNRFVSEQPPYHLLDRRVERELLPMAQTYGIAVLPYSPLAGGFLTGKYRRGRPWPQDARYARIVRERGESDHLRRLAGDAASGVVETLVDLAARKGCTPGQLALAWLLGQAGVTSPIIGPRTVRQLEDNLGALEVQLDDEDRRRLNEVAPPGGVIVPYYEADFGPQPHRW